MGKRIYVWLLAFVMSTSTCRHKNDSHFVVPDLNFDVAQNLTFTSITLEDEQAKNEKICQKERDSAATDINNNKLTYFHGIGWIKDADETRLYKLLENYNISVDTAYYSCIVSGPQNCYAEAMNNEISNRFGENFIDSLRTVSEKMPLVKGKKCKKQSS